MSRIGCQAQRSTPEALAFARRSHIVKGVNQTDVLQQAPDDAIRIFRWVFGSQGLSDPWLACQTILYALNHYRHRNLYVETYNEMPKESLGAYIAFLQAIVPMLHGAGLKVCGPSWATGDYEQRDWDAFRAVNWCGIDAIALHAYWADRGPTVYNGLRWRTYYDAALDGHRLVVLTEVGRDRIRDGDNGTYIGRGGWKADGLSADTYAAELNAYSAQLLPHEWALPFISGPEPTWVNYDMDPISPMLDASPVWTAPPPIPLPTPGGPPVTPPITSTYSSPNHGGVRGTTNGIVIHSTRGGSASTQTEYDATKRWFDNPASQVSAHAVVGPNGQVAYPVNPKEIAWHAREYNQHHLGIELCQCEFGDALNPTIVDQAAKVVAAWCQVYKIPIVWDKLHGLVEHFELDPAKSDISAPFDRADFLARVKHYTGVEDVTFTPEEKKALLGDFEMLWGMTKADTIGKNPAESERACHERIAALKVKLGLN